MGRVVANFFMSLDGVVEDPFLFMGDLFDEAMGEIMSAGLARQQAFLLGRRLYDEWSEYWPSNTDEPFAGHINSIPKYVLSSTLTDPQWQHTTVIPGAGAAARVAELKSSVEGEIATSGSATTVRWLLSEGLLDELSLLVFPVAQGKGRRLFEDASTHRLRLLESRALATGVLHLRYAPEVR